MQIIRNDLHCNAVRVTGGDLNRLKIAATDAVDAGLEIWLSPFTNGLTQDDLFDLLADCADHAGPRRRPRTSPTSSVPSSRRVAQGKPVAVTEFGCMTYRGAADVAGDIHSLIVWDNLGRPTRMNGEYVRDEDAQAAYLRESPDVFDAEGVDAAFVYTFARYDLPHRGDPSTDLGLASRGVVKVLDGAAGGGGPAGRRYPDMPWEPKAAFDAVAASDGG